MDSLDAYLRLDSPSIRALSEVDEKDVLEKLKEVLIEDLLPLKHKHPYKKQINITSARINFACPYCGDSKKDPTAKRGNIYFNSTFYVCYNCFEKKPVLKFLEDFDLDGMFTGREIKILREIAPQTEKSRIRSNIVHYARDSKTYEKYLWSRKLIKKSFGFIEVNNDVSVCKYLESRLIGVEYFYYYLYDSINNHLIILNCSHDGSLIISFQRRKLGAWKKNKYLSTVYTDIASHLGFKNIKENISNFFDTMSLYINILNTDFNKPIHVFEGFMDAIMLPNSISMSSAGNLIDQKMLYYIFDDDDTGRKQAIKVLDAGSFVFMWKKFKKDNQEFKFDEGGNRVKDFNQMYRIRHPGYGLIESYFTNKKLDKIKI